jgi:hypothetical protein
LFVLSLPRKIQKDHLPNNLRRHRRRKKEVLEGKLKRRSVYKTSVNTEY